MIWMTSILNLYIILYIIRTKVSNIKPNIYRFIAAQYIFPQHCDNTCQLMETQKEKPLFTEQLFINN